MIKDAAGIGAVAKSVGEVAKPFAETGAELLSLFLKPTATEAGLLLGDFVRIARQITAAKVMAKAKAKLDAEKKQINPVSAKTLVPLLEACSLEDDEDMIERWANLLATSAEFSNGILPAYVRTLAEMSPADAKVLDSVLKLQKDIRTNRSSGRSLLGVKIAEIRGAVQITDANYFDRVIANLQRLGLLRQVFEPAVVVIGGFLDAQKESDFLGITTYGYDFLSICNRAPNFGRSEAVGLYRPRLPFR